MYMDKKRISELRLCKLQDKPARTSAEQIERLERKIGTKFPEDYRCFLTEFGGWSIDAEFDVDPRCPGGGVQQVEAFYGSSADDPDIGELWSTYKMYADRLPPGSLPIASDGMGNQIVLSLRPEDFGAVSFLDRSEEHNPGDNVSNERALYRCAANFTQFLDKLRPIKESDDDSPGERIQDRNPEAGELWRQLVSGKLSLEERKRLMRRMEEIAKMQKLG